jgi:2-keto-4-pentenoate hydratase/2-oxohepta-3-ene-1,7-dioic acid hydratase in catechol pathway
VKVVRFRLGDQVRTGIVEGDDIREVQGDVFSGGSALRKTVALSHVKLLAPCAPSKIVAVGLNYRDHAGEMGKALPAEPLLFLKPGTAVLDPGGVIEWPAMAGRVDYEGELGVVIGKRTKNVTPAEAPSCILGYTVVNDVTARDLQARDVQYTRAKGFDTFAPLGPWIETEFDPSDRKIETRLNGKTRQAASTSLLIFPPAALVSFVSRVMTLLPGDVIATGTPAGIGPMEPGDVVEITIEGIGTLTNTMGNKP